MEEEEQWRQEEARTGREWGRGLVDLVQEVGRFSGRGRILDSFQDSVPQHWSTWTCTSKFTTAGLSRPLQLQRLTHTHTHRAREQMSPEPKVTSTPLHTHQDAAATILALLQQQQVRRNRIEL